MVFCREPHQSLKMLHFFLLDTPWIPILSFFLSFLPPLYPPNVIGGKGFHMKWTHNHHRWSPKWGSSWVFLSHKVNTRRSLHSLQFYPIITQQTWMTCHLGQVNTSHKPRQELVTLPHYHNTFLVAAQVTLVSYLTPWDEYTLHFPIVALFFFLMVGTWIILLSP